MTCPSSQDPSAGPLSDGGFATGDLAELEDGVIRLRGRKSSLIRTGGERVDSEEV